MTQKISFLEVVFLCLLLVSGLLLPQVAQAEQQVIAKAAGNVPVAFQPRDALTPSTNVTKSLQDANSPLVFSAPPRGSYAEEVTIYEPIVQLLAKIIGRKIEYKYSDNWLSYSKEMTEGRYDIVFDGPAFNGWRIEKLSHTPLVRLPEDFIFVVVAKAGNDRIKNLKDLAGRMICAHAPPNLGTLTLLSQFDNPARQPVIVETKGWDNAYKALMDDKCVATVLPLKNLSKNDAGAQRLTKTLYQHKALPNQAFSVGPRIAPELHTKIAKALLSEEGKQATAGLRTAYASKDFIQATRQEYADLGELLKSSLYYQ